MWWIVLCLYRGSRLGQEAEDGGLFVEIRKGAEFAPFGNGEGANVFVGAGEVGGDAEAGGGFAGGEDGGEHLVIAIGRFDEYFGAVEALGIRFEVLEGLGAGGIVDGQIAGEPKLLAVETAGHEGEEDGAGADQGFDDGTGFVGGFGEKLTGVCNAGATRFAEDTDVFSCF